MKSSEIFEMCSLFLRIIFFAICWDVFPKWFWGREEVGEIAQEPKALALQAKWSNWVQILRIPHDQRFELCAQSLGSFVVWDPQAFPWEWFLVRIAKRNVTTGKCWKTRQTLQTPQPGSMTPDKQHTYHNQNLWVSVKRACFLGAEGE